jgi:DNA polymerase-3 subunit delta'
MTEQDAVRALAARDFKAAEGLPWLAPVRAQVQRAAERDRLPHALLIHATSGLGSESLAAWIAALALCDKPASAPCGECAECHLLTAGNHPDLLWVTREDDAKQLQIDQIRALCETLALKSYRGGYKVAVVTTADVMNANAANALLKTLEEPPPQSLLILCSARPSRLPATVVSRCLRLTIPTPPPAQALEWLESHAEGGWTRILQYASGAPLRALELRASAFEQLDEEMRQAVARLARRELDIPTTAGRWAKDALERRLEWIETWITDSIRTALSEPADLQSSGGIRKIRGLYGVLDHARGMRLELSTSLNMQLAAEELLLRAESALTTST